ncbi:MAG: hypothetical protein AB1918_09340, partial [Pseudomonadota bacterium]
MRSHERVPSLLPIVAVPLAALIFVGALWWGMISEFHQSRRDAEAATAVIAGNLAHAIEEHTARTVHDVDRLLRLLATAFPARMDDRLHMMVAE